MPSSVPQVENGLFDCFVLLFASEFTDEALLSIDCILRCASPYTARSQASILGEEGCTIKQVGVAGQFERSISLKNLWDGDARGLVSARFLIMAPKGLCTKN